MMTFGADEHPRSLQMYGSDPVMIGEAIRRVCDADRVDHIDINFGCPAAKVTRKGGGAAVPAKPNLLRAILRAAVAAASPYGVPVTAKFRKGLFDIVADATSPPVGSPSKRASPRSPCTPARPSSTTPVPPTGTRSAS